MNLILAFMFAVQAQTVILDGFRFAGGGGGAPSYTIEENLEASPGYDMGWFESVSAGSNEDYTATVLQGAESLFISGTSSTSLRYIVNDPGFSGTEWYGYFMVRFVSLNASNGEFFSVAVNGVGDELIMYASAASGWQVVNGTEVSGFINSPAVAVDTTYHVWWYYKQSTGADDGISRLWVSTSGTKPGSATCEVTDGDSVGNVDVISPRARGSTGQIIFDRILLSTSAIGDNP